jgi:hypothetical protein
MYASVYPILRPQTDATGGMPWLALALAAVVLIAVMIWAWYSGRQIRDAMAHPHEDVELPTAA